jgi:hypothetical protein
MIIQILTSEIMLLQSCIVFKQKKARYEAGSIQSNTSKNYKA